MDDNLASVTMDNVCQESAARIPSARLLMVVTPAKPPRCSARTPLLRRIRRHNPAAGIIARPTLAINRA